MWFAANLLFEGASPDDAPESSLWEERIVLLDAGSEDAARQAAEQIGKDGEHEYTSATGELVRWRFHGTERVYSIDSPVLESGVEVFSRFLRPGEVASLRTPFADDPVAEKAESRP
jgi:hypothetical protein